MSTDIEVDNNIENKEIKSSNKLTLAEMLQRALDIRPTFNERITKFEVEYEALEEKMIKLIGKQASMDLSVLVAKNGSNVLKYGNEKIKCQGKIEGERTIRQLLDEKILTQSGKNQIWALPDVPVPIEEICEAVPYASLLYAKSQKDQGKNISMFKKDIKTSLPFELQFIQAACLPLTEKLRSAHITFTLKLLKSVGKKFEASAYIIRMSYSARFSKMEDVGAIINDLESEIVLNDDEIDMTVGKAVQMDHPSLIKHLYFNI